MKASWRENLFLGLISFVFTFLFSIANNTWQMSILRAVIGFLVFFLLGYVLRVLLHLFAIQSSLVTQSEETEEELGEQEEQQETMENEQVEDPFFQGIPLGSLHNGDRIKNQ